MKRYNEDFMNGLSGVDFRFYFSTQMNHSFNPQAPVAQKIVD